MLVKEHYDNHLANFYSWMMGDFEEKMNSFKSFCIDAQINPIASRVAVDLGAGTGIQSVALARLGFDVVAIDFSQKLLNELVTKSENLSIQIIKEDIRTSDTYAARKPELIVCAGDTITHLNSLEEVRQLLRDAYDSLVPKGKMLISFRDYSVELKDTSRFIPVRNEADKILTCFLEYTPGKVRVTDILNERIGDTWQQKISSYEKVRISRDELQNMLTSCGFSIELEAIDKGMITIVGTKT